MAHPARAQSVRSPKSEKQTSLQRALTTALNELGADSALVGVFEVEGGLLSLQGCRGFAPREARAILRTVSTQDIDALHAPVVSADGESFRAMRLRMITPVAKTLLAVPLQHHQRTYGVLVIGRKESTSYTKKEKTLLEHAGDQITAALHRADLFDGTLLLRRPTVGYEPASSAPVSASVPPEPLAPPESYSTPQLQEKVTALLNTAAATLPFDRALVTAYDPVTSVIEIIGMAGEMKTIQRKTSGPACASRWIPRPPGGPSGTARRAWTWIWPPRRAGSSTTNRCIRNSSPARWSCRFSFAARSAGPSPWLRKRRCSIRFPIPSNWRA
jgi:hypothetical protein